MNPLAQFLLEDFSGKSLFFFHDTYLSALNSKNSFTVARALVINISPWSCFDSLICVL